MFCKYFNLEVGFRAKKTSLGILVDYLKGYFKNINIKGFYDYPYSFCLKNGVILKIMVGNIKKNEYIDTIDFYLWLDIDEISFKDVIKSIPWPENTKITETSYLD